MDEHLLRIEDRYRTEMGEYFSSLQDSFQSSLHSVHEEDSLQSALVWTIIASVFSVIPLLPLIIWGGIRYFASGWTAAVKGVPLPVQSFLFWWALLGVISIAVAVGLNTIEKRRSKRREAETLDAAPMRFALCNAIAQEIDHYTKNRLPKHIERAGLYWRRLLPMLVRMLNPLDGHFVREAYEVTSIGAPELDINTIAPELRERGFITGPGLWKYRSAFPQVDLLRTSHSWFKLDPTTTKIVNAFNTLPLKLTERIKDKKDLPAVEAVLRSLSVYLYSVIPEVSSIEDSDSSIKQFGEDSLIQFADSLDHLAPYRAEPRPLGSKEKVTFKFTSAITCIAGLFCHDSLLVKFFSWWLLVQALVVVAIATASHYVAGLKLDSTLISLVVGTPLLVSAAALASPLRKK